MVGYNKKYVKLALNYALNNLKKMILASVIIRRCRKDNIE